MNEEDVEPNAGQPLVRPPKLSGRRVSLVPVMPEHHQQIYFLSLGDDTGFRWRFRGAIPSFELFQHSLTTSVFVQFSIVLNSDARRVLGCVTAYNPSIQDGTVYVGIVTDKRIGAGGVEAMALFLRYCFCLWPLRKIYLETPEYNLGQFASALEAGLLKEEGRLRGDRYFNDNYWDLVILALYREDGEAMTERFANMFGPDE